MVRYLAVLIVVVFVACNTSPAGQAAEKEDGLVLTVRWQRLVDEAGQTCDRCGSTEAELNQATAALTESLGTLGIDVVVVTAALDQETCAEDISQSNRIWLGERALEEWLGATVGMSVCGFCCAELGDAVECRTVTVSGQTYEVIPSVLIIRAGLLAAAHLLAAPAGDTCVCAACPKSGVACCPPPEETEGE